jgi:hypothetical protein
LLEQQTAQTQTHLAGLLAIAEKNTFMLARLTLALECLVATLRLPLRIGRSLASIPSRLLRRFLRTTPSGPTEWALGELTAGRTLEQRLQCTADCWSSVRLKIGTYDRANTCNLRLTITDETGRSLRTLSAHAAKFRNGQLHGLAFEPLHDCRNRTFWLRITSPDAAPGNAIVLGYRAGTEDGLRVDGTAVPGRLLIDPIYADADPMMLDGQRDLLVLTPDQIGDVRVGLGMRHWEIARALASRQLTVTLATPHSLADGLAGEGFPLYHVTSEADVLALARRHRALLVQGEIMEHYPALKTLDRPIAVDLAAPLHIENLQRNQPDFEFSQRVILKGLERGDFFLCGNERQRLYWLGLLTVLGRLQKSLRDVEPELRNLIDIVGFGISEEPPRKTQPVIRGVMPGIGVNDFLMTWFGGIWDWLDPLPLVRAAGAAWQHNPRIKLLFISYRIPNGTIPAMARRSRDLAESLGLLGKCVFFQEYPIPYASRADYLLETDLGVLCQAANLETQLSARTRVLEYLWAERPLLLNAGDEWAATIRRLELGLVLEKNDVSLWQEAMLRLAEDAALRTRMQANIAAFKPQLLWKQCIEPLHRFVLQQRAYAVPDWGAWQRAG